MAKLFLAGSQMGLRALLSIAGRGRQRKTRVEQFAPAWRQEGARHVIVPDSQMADLSNSNQMAAEAFKQLIKGLEGLNENLHSQAVASGKLAGRIDKLPDMLANLPDINESQRKMVDSLLESLCDRSTQERQLVDAIEKIPSETARQTEELTTMREKLVAAADADMSMRRHLDKFIAVLDRMDSSTTDQSESIKQMQKTFAASDRYLKYLIVKQNKRIIWIFAAALGICLFAIGTLAAVIAYIVSY